MRLRGRLAILALVGCVAVGALGAEQPPGRKKLLFLTHAGLYKHTSLGPAEKAVIELGKTGGFDVTTVEGYKQEAEKIDSRLHHARIPRRVRPA